MIRSIVLIGLAGMMSLTGQSQTSGNEKQPASAAAETISNKFYQLNFVIQELEHERVINSRSYSIIMRGAKDRGFIRAGEKVPYTSESGANNQWQQIDVGVNIDCQKLEEMGTGVSLLVKAEVSSVMETQGEKNLPIAPPVIRNNQWESDVVLPLKQPTIIYSSDDPASKRRMQLQLTVTSIH